MRKRMGWLLAFCLFCGSIYLYININTVNKDNIHIWQAENNLEQLKKALQDANWKLRVRSVNALGTIGGKEAAVLLIAAIKDDHPNVRSTVCWWLGRLKAHKAIPPLIVMLKDQNWAVRARAAQALGTIGEKRTLTELKTLLSDENDQVRANTAAAIGKIGGLE
ncbi:MAG: HEAT repeat domain-containing protein [Candidatus Schekmanbacteria bacterium]|nr:HEAT repeat domain-containing protein [Candidatus Schekmanbacteria bacterium]